MNDKNLQQIGNSRELFQCDKRHLQKSIANIILNCERFSALSLRSGIRQRRSFSPVVFNIVPETLASIIRKDKEIKTIWIKKEVNCLF